MPDNYKALELNEALINWFNPMSNYNEVVSAAADEAGGQGFVTEFAGGSDALEDVVVSAFDRQKWNEISTTEYATETNSWRRRRASSASPTASKAR